MDLETTGLMGGAGTYAFLVGCAWFDGGTFRVRQYLMSSPTVERAMLGAMAELAGEAGTVVTYNGKTFDLPLIETRFLFHRLDVALCRPAARGHAAPGAPAVAATATSAAGGDDYGMSTPVGCRLTTLERTLCGFEREGDVPGFEIPDRYFRFVRTGDARPLDGVLEHNRLDLLSLALSPRARRSWSRTARRPCARRAKPSVLDGCISSRAGSTTRAAASAWRVASMRTAPACRCQPAAMERSSAPTRCLRSHACHVVRDSSTTRPPRGPVC